MRIQRRRFVKLLAFGTATSLVAGKLWRRDLLAFCELPSGREGAALKVRLSDYPAFQQDYGSVRLSINPIGSKYKVRFRERLQDDWGPASFATTPGGPVSETSLTGLGTPATIYLDRTTPTGFYIVSMDVFEI